MGASNHRGFDMKPLTQTELQHLHLMAYGLTRKGIAKEMGISENTVKDRVKILYQKLNASTSGQAVYNAIRNGLM